MTAYEWMLRTNCDLIQGRTFTDRQKDEIVSHLLCARSTSEKAQRFYEGVKYPQNMDKQGRRLYPIFYIPPYNDGKKLKTVLGQTPKTQILSANLYELEILRLLVLLAPEKQEVQRMVAATLQRLKTTCFGFCDDGLGECFDASLVVLRFLCTAAPGETQWIQSRIENYHRHEAEKKRPWFCLWYFWLCLSEMPEELAEPEIKRYQTQMIHQLRDKSYVMMSETDRTVHPVLVCMLRNLLAKSEEFAHLANYEPYLSPKDGRLHFPFDELI